MTIMDLVASDHLFEILDETKREALRTIIDLYFTGNRFQAETRFLCVNDDAADGALRALKFSRFNVETACKYIEDNLEWRAKNHLNEILSKNHLLTTRQLHLIRTAFGDGFFGEDRNGFPIYWCPIGSIDFSQLRNEISLELMVHYHVQMMEFNQQVYLKKFSEERNRTYHSFTCIVDLKGFSPRQLTKHLRETLSEISTLDRDYYHDNFHRVIVINAPLVIRLFWRTASAFFRSETKAKFLFLSNPNELAHYVDMDQVPRRFGGNVPDDDILYSISNSSMQCCLDSNGNVNECYPSTVYTRLMDSQLSLHARE